MSRWTWLSIGVCTLTAALWLPAATVRADSLLGPKPNRCQRINPGSYSPLHYWLPSLYTFRAYHRPGNFIDQAEYNLQPSDASAGYNSVNGCTASGVQKKDEGK